MKACKFLEAYTQNCHPVASVIGYWPEEISKPARFKEGEILSRAGWEVPRSHCGKSMDPGKGREKIVVVLQSNTVYLPLPLPGILVPRMDHRGYGK